MIVEGGCHHIRRINLRCITRQNTILVVQYDRHDRVVQDPSVGLYPDGPIRIGKLELSFYRDGRPTGRLVADRGAVIERDSANVVRGYGERALPAFLAECE